MRSNAGITSIKEISIRGTNEYRRKDWILINFLILLRSNCFKVNNFKLKKSTPAEANANITSCHEKNGLSKKINGVNKRMIELILIDIPRSLKDSGINNLF